MSGIKLSQLTSASSISDDDLFLITQDGMSKIITGAMIKEYIGYNSSSVSVAYDENTGNLAITEK